MHVPPLPTLRLPLMRYATLLNGPNQQPEDGLQAWERVLRAQQHSSSEAMEGFTSSVKSSTTSESGDAELEILSR